MTLAIPRAPGLRSSRNSRGRWRFCQNSSRCKGRGASYLGRSGLATGMQPWVLERERGVPEGLAPPRRGWGWGQFAYVFCLHAYSMIQLIEVLLYSQIFRHYPSRKSEDISAIPTSLFFPNFSFIFLQKTH